MDRYGNIGERVLEEASPRSRAAIRAALTEDFDSVSDRSAPASSRRLSTGRSARNLLSRVEQQRNRIVLSSGSDDELDRDVSPDTHFLNFTTSDDDLNQRSLFVPRPRRDAAIVAAEREARNRQLIRERNNARANRYFAIRERRRLAPMITMDSSSSDLELSHNYAKKKREQEEADYQLALKLSAEWNKENDASEPSTSTNATSGASSSGRSAGVMHKNFSDFDNDFQCVICFEVPDKPVGCLHCRQLLGCHGCVLKWRYTSNISRLNRGSPLSRGISSANHRCCPLCRVEWADEPEVAPWEDVRFSK